MTLRKKFIIGAIIVTIIGLIVHFRTQIPKTPKLSDVDIASTSTTSSSEDISAIVAEMVESQVAEKLAEMNSNPTVTTAPATVTATAVKVVPQEVTTAVTTANPKEDSNVESETTTEDGFITFVQGNVSYSVQCMSSAYEAAFYSTFCKNNGRDIHIPVSDDVTSISIAISFRDVDNNLSKLSDFEELALMQTENGREAQYSIPDNPLRNDAYFKGCPRFYGVFRLDTTSGCEYFAISY